MAIAQAVTCDVCGKQKGSVNHWFMYQPYDTEVRVYRWMETMVASTSHACGQECLVQAVNKWMQEQAA